MKEHYVSYEQAKRLKALGFRWKVDRYYTYWYESECPEDDAMTATLHRSGLHDHNGTFNNPLSEDGIHYSAPRLDQAAAWIREEKGIDINISAYQHLDGESVKHQYNFGVLTINGETFANTWYDNYEQALFYAIDTALELLGKEAKQ